MLAEESHDGGTMLQRFCFLRRRASQSGREARWGGIRRGVVVEMRGSGSRRCRGITVMRVDSARKDSSDGRRGPWGSI